MSIVIDEKLSGERLDIVLTRKISNTTRSQAKRLIEAGHVTIGGHPLKPSHTSRRGEVIDVVIPPPVPSHLEAETIPLDILYEDDDLLVINKPAGLVVHPAAGHPRGTLVNALLAHCGKLSTIGGEHKPGIVHRLDKGTSGVMVVAKNDATHFHLSRQFADRTVTKVYVALVHGSLKAESGQFTTALGRSMRDRKKISSHTRKGREATTLWRVLERFASFYTLVEVRLLTGRTHQIRVHFSEARHPLVGDETYGGRIPDFGRVFQRPALHAFRLTFLHPTIEREMTFEAPLADDFRTLLEWHRETCHNGRRF
ncbi:MAG: RluA family pseudouridine synthase [Deltaproteobacteria bacterium]|nr:RluA family pseudouridine synthase [Deltaproteobacteria bacterium]